MSSSTSVQQFVNPRLLKTGMMVNVKFDDGNCRAVIIETTRIAHNRKDLGSVSVRVFMSTNDLRSVEASRITEIIKPSIWVG